MSQRSVENKVEGSQHLSLGSFLPILICGFFSLLACFCFCSLRLTLKAGSVRSCCSVLVSVWPRSPWAVCFPKVGQSQRGQELVGSWVSHDPSVHLHFPLRLSGRRGNRGSLLPGLPLTWRASSVSLSQQTADEADWELRNTGYNEQHRRL